MAYIIPLEYVENKSFCLFCNLFGFTCFGCGMTRAIFNLLHLNFSKAIDFNIGIIFWVPVFIIVVTNDIYITIKLFFSKSFNNFIQ